ncbi:MAG: TRAP transporter small permease [Pseudomonadota bacterium]
MKSDAEKPPLSLPPAFVKTLAAIDEIGIAAGWAAAACLLALTVLIAGEVILRALSNVISAVPGTIPIAWEYSSYLMGAAFMFGMATTLRNGAHIRVSIMIAALSPTAVRNLEIVATLIGVAASAFLAFSLWGFAIDSFVRGEVSTASASPIWLPKMAIALGATVFALQMAARLARAIAKLPPDRSADKTQTQEQ